MRLTITVDVEEGKPYNAKLIDLLFEIARKLNGHVRTSSKLLPRQ